MTVELRIISSHISRCHIEQKKKIQNHLQFVDKPQTDKKEKKMGGKCIFWDLFNETA